MNLKFSLFGLVLVAGCTTTLPADRAVVDPYVPVVPAVPVAPRAVTGSIFLDQSSSRLFGHKREYSVGDVVTVVLTESTQAQRRSGLEATKEGNNATLKGLQALLKNPLNTPFAAQDFDNLAVETKGFGSANQAASLNGAIAVMVTQVLPNNNLVIQGQKKLSLSEGSETIRLSGVISSRDIQPDNTVLSSRIAGAQIAYQGTGDLADFSKVNWGTQLFNKVWPF
ncbi:MAG: hypothetical protein CMQ44_08135 [Gammaproteobacteria bacterium]|nr:hypothetical protein [Gammaproteobacteria bacterium]|tara:strand:+ start:1982 stop:2656 length:675 start_codon:yes stop_codon:yes gene_type:complete